MIGTFRLVEIEPLDLRWATRGPDEYSFSLANTLPQNSYHKFMLLDFLGTPKLPNGD